MNAKTVGACLIILLVAAYLLMSRNENNRASARSTGAVDRQSESMPAGVEANEPLVPRMDDTRSSIQPSSTAPARVDASWKGRRAGEIANENASNTLRSIVRIGERVVKQEALVGETFPTIFMDAPEDVSVSVGFPRCEVGDPVHIQILDGGVFPDHSEIARSVILGPDKFVSFNYRPTGERGKFRIKLRVAAQVGTVEFWMGQKPVLGG
jgi:hypothetical protein